MLKLNEVLPSWCDTPTKQAILGFVAAVTAESGPSYVPPAERIATFDNDGALWCGRPMYIQMVARADITSSTYYNWMIDRAYIMDAAQFLIKQFLDTFDEFPARIKPASFSVNQALEKLEHAMHSN